MSDAEKLYSFRRPFQNVLQRERAQDVQLPASYGGELVAPSSGTFSLIGPDGVAVIDAEAVTITDLVATYSIAAIELPSTLGYGELYQERWALEMPDGTTRTVRRECAIAPFLIHPVLAEADITEGEYPDLVNELGDDFDSLQPFITEGWRRLLEWLFKQGQWPDLMLSTSAFRRPHREWALFLIFKHLFRVTSGNNRWEKLMNHHKAELSGSLDGFTSRIDYDVDGLPDDRSRQAAKTVIHKNAGPFRRLGRSAKW